MQITATHSALHWLLIPTLGPVLSTKDSGMRKAYGTVIMMLQTQQV